MYTKGYTVSGSKVKTMMPMLQIEPTYDQFCGTLRYRQMKTPYAVKHPKYRVSLKEKVSRSIMAWY